MDFTNKALNKYIDHTLLKPTATIHDFEVFLQEALKYQFASICVPPYVASPLKTTLSQWNNNLKVCTVADFPLGHSPLDIKIREITALITTGVNEIDFVLNYRRLKEKDFKGVVTELKTISELCKKNNVISKCIVETCYLTMLEKEIIFKLAADYAPSLDFLKTSTGFGENGATVEDIELWDRLRGQNIKPAIKASGSIKTWKQAKQLLEAGADRLGTSSSVAIIRGYHEEKATVFPTRGKED